MTGENSQFQDTFTQRRIPRDGPAFEGALQHILDNACRRHPLNEQQGKDLQMVQQYVTELPEEHLHRLRYLVDRRAAGRDSIAETLLEEASQEVYEDLLDAARTGRPLPELDDLENDATNLRRFQVDQLGCLKLEDNPGLQDQLALVAPEQQTRVDAALREALLEEQEALREISLRLQQRLRKKLAAVITGPGSRETQE